jgi:hypothetical protein
VADAAPGPSAPSSDAGYRHIRRVTAARVRLQALRRAADIAGGPAQLRGYLEVSAPLLTLWMSGTIATPLEVFLKVVDLIVKQAVSDLQ